MCVSIFPSSSPRSFWLGSKLRCYQKVLSREVWTYEGCAIYSHEEPISEKNLGTVDDENSQHSYFWHWKFFTCKIQILRKSVHYEKDNKNFLTSKKNLDFDLGKGTSKSAVLSAPCARYCVSVWDCQNNCPYKKLRGQTRQPKPQGSRLCRQHGVTPLVTQFLGLPQGWQEKPEQGKVLKYDLSSWALLLFVPVVPSILQGYEGKVLISVSSPLPLKVSRSI